MKYVGKYKKLLMIAAVLVTGSAGLLVWTEREDRMQGGRDPNSLAKNTLIGIWQYESIYLSEHNDFARSLSKLQVINRIDAHTIEFVPSESNLQTVVYRAIPDRFNWMMVDLSTYAIAIVKSRSTKWPKNLICYGSSNSIIIPKVEVSTTLQKNVDPLLKCPKGSHEVYYP